MDIDLLSKMVKELILDNDRVVLPGLGSFVAEVVPATFSDKGYTINPPYRKLYFRSRPDEGTELAAFYAETNSVPEDVAEKVIKDFVSELKSVLFVKKTVIFPGLGRLRATKENNVFFVSDEDLDIYPEGFGLQPISLKTHQESREEVSAAIVGLKSMLESRSAVESAVDSEPITEPAHVTEPESVPEPEIAEPELMVEPEEETITETMDEAAEEPEVLEEQVEVPVQPEIEEEEESDAEPIETPAEKPGKALKVFGKVVLWTVVTAVVVLAAYIAVGHLCPEWLDGFLYTPEELEIIKGI